MSAPVSCMTTHQKHRVAVCAVVVLLLRARDKTNGCAGAIVTADVDLTRVMFEVRKLGQQGPTGSFACVRFM
jgi:hypothetical protein